MTELKTLKILKTIVRQRDSATHRLELLELSRDAGWGDWRYQLNLWAIDGAKYGRPGEMFRTTMANFISLEDALRSFENSKSVLGMNDETEA